MSEYTPIKLDKDGKIIGNIIGLKVRRKDDQTTSIVKRQKDKRFGKDNGTDNNQTPNSYEIEKAAYKVRVKEYFANMTKADYAEYRKERKEILREVDKVLYDELSKGVKKTKIPKEMMDKLIDIARQKGVAEDVVKLNEEIKKDYFKKAIKKENKILREVKQQKIKTELAEKVRPSLPRKAKNVSKVSGEKKELPKTTLFKELTKKGKKSTDQRKDEDDALKSKKKKFKRVDPGIIKKAKEIDALRKAKDKGWTASEFEFKDEKLQMVFTATGKIPEPKYVNVDLTYTTIKKNGLKKEKPTTEKVEPLSFSGDSKFQLSLDLSKINTVEEHVLKLKVKIKEQGTAGSGKVNKFETTLDKFPNKLPAPKIQSVNRGQDGKIKVTFDEKVRKKNEDQYTDFIQTKRSGELTIQEESFIGKFSEKYVKKQVVPEFKLNIEKVDVEGKKIKVTFNQIVKSNASRANIYSWSTYSLVHRKEGGNLKTLTVENVNFEGNVATLILKEALNKTDDLYLTLGKWFTDNYGDVYKEDVYEVHKVEAKIDGNKVTLIKGSTGEIIETIKIEVDGEGIGFEKENNILTIKDLRQPLKEPTVKAEHVYSSRKIDSTYTIIAETDEDQGNWNKF